MGDQIDEDEEIIPLDPILYPLIEERQTGLSHSPIPESVRTADAVLTRINGEEEAGA